jgi:pimeloyl-ACP methyl ester carboxylesterase
MLKHGGAIGPRWLRMTVRLVLIAGAISLVAVASAAAFNYFAVRHYRAISPVPGDIYSVGGYKTHLYCIGSGTPTVVLESGLGDDFLIWGRVQKELAKVTRVCSYDRSGLGWSEVRPGLRDSNTVSDQLHELLVQARISGQILLMGHSLGGLHIRVYACRYPSEVVGLAFVDGCSPEQSTRLPRSMLDFQQHSMTVEANRQKLKSALGLQRVLGRCGQAPPGYEAYAALFKADDCIPSSISVAQREFDAFERSCREAAQTGPLSNLPILIFSQDPNHRDPDMPANLQSEVSPVWNSMQEDLKNLSPRSRRIIVRGTSHYIQSQRPELLNKEVTEFVLQIRAGTLHSSEYGSTIIE